jgi:VanZ family protein
VNLKELFPKVLFFSALLSVTVLALLPVEMLTSPVFNWWDKAQHALAFTVLSLLGFAAFPARLGQVALGMALYGVAIELAQLAVGWRFGEWQDVLADITGVMVAWGLRSLWRKWRVAA